MNILRATEIVRFTTPSKLELLLIKENSQF